MVFDEGYIKPEESCGYYITQKMKKVRYIQLGILQQIIRICEKYNLMYFAEGGTLIGAIRHQGYIPWDDDIDVVLKREDFNIFCEVAQNELEYPYHFMTSATEKGFFANSAYICNSDSTCISANNPNNKWQSYNKGISIGIEVMDACNPNLFWTEIVRSRLHIFSILGNVCVGINRMKVLQPLGYLLRAMHFSPSKLWVQQQKFLTRYNKKWLNSGKCIIFLPIAQSVKKSMHNSEYFCYTRKVPFEFLSINVPEGFDGILKTQFGNYMEFPPQSHRVPKHEEIYEPEIPYKVYCEKHYGVKYD